MTNDATAAEGGGRAALSVVLVTADRFETIRRTVEHLHAQTIRDRIELVIVAPAADIGADPALLDGFAAVQVVELNPIVAVGPSNAAGVRHATAPIVALSEDHCFPDPDWAEAFVRAHAGPYVAVGPVVRNANPATAMSWADLFINYGPWLDPAEGGDVPFLPGHNTSYKRDMLLAFGERLDALLDAETLLHWELRAAGHRLRLEPAARIRHTNFSRVASWVPVHFHAGRSFAAARREGMSPLKRLVFVAGSPAIPLVRLVRLSRTVPRALRARFLRVLPITLAGLVLDGAGQLLGYARGAGPPAFGMMSYEYRRIDHITPADREAVFGE